MKKAHWLSALMILLLLTLTACMPAGYTSDQKKAVTKEHSAEAKEWFAANLSGARVESAEAYANGINLFSVITGKYRFEGKSYDYFYEFEKDEMYLGFEYAQAVEAAEAQVSRMFQGVRDVELHPSKYSFSATVLNNKGGEYPNSAEYGTVMEINAQEILPAGADPGEYGEKLLREGFGGVTYIEVYGENIPGYDRAFFDEYEGVSAVNYTIPASFEYDDIYRVSYSAREAEYHHLKLTSLKDGIYGGYIYKIEDTYDESGVQTGHFDDSGDYDPDHFFEDTGKDTFTMCIPPGNAQPIIIGPKHKYVRSVKIKEDTYNQTALDEWGKLSYRYSSDTETFYYNIILPKSKLRMYSRINATGSDDGIYNIEIE